MTPLLKTGDGNTPLSPEELADLIPSLATKEELNEWERQNIILAREWAVADRASLNDIVSDAYVRKLRLKMFDQTWKWAGRYRQTEKNLGVAFDEIPEGLTCAPDGGCAGNEERSSRIHLGLRRPRQTG